MEFEDSDFPANVSSLFDPSDAQPDSDTKFFAELEWKRASQIYSEGYSIFPDDLVLDPDHIKQGQLGDCYFVSCLSALAAKP